MSLGVSITNTDVGQAVSQANQTMADITKALGEIGIDPKDIQTTNYNVWPQQKVDPQTGEATGSTIYHVDSSLQVKVRQIDQAGQVIQKALDAGANSVNGLSFGIDDPKPLEFAGPHGGYRRRPPAGGRAGRRARRQSRRPGPGQRIYQRRPRAVCAGCRGRQGAGRRPGADQHRAAQRERAGERHLPVGALTSVSQPEK